jgi:hypothetical protein
MIKREWTEEDCDSSTKEDYLAGFFSALSYFAWALGIYWAIMLEPEGVVLVVVAVVSTFLTFYIIDPKLKAQSETFEKRQLQYLELLRNTQSWTMTEEEEKKLEEDIKGLEGKKGRKRR